MRSLIDLTKTTQTLLTHYQSSLSPSQATQASLEISSPQPNPLETIKATTTLLKSHTTTLSLLLLTPPLTPSAVISKIGDVSSGVLSAMVAAASSTAQQGQKDELGESMRTELRAQVRRVLSGWGEVLALVLRFAERREEEGKKKDDGPTEAAKQDVLAATGVVWEACDALLRTCADGIVGLVVKKAEEYRSVLLDAVEELKEWGEDVESEEDEDEGLGSDGEDEDDIFGAANKLGKGNTELKVLLDSSVKKLKMVGILYQALIKRRLKTFPKMSTPTNNTNGETSDEPTDPMRVLDKLMVILKDIPETVDDLASAFYDLDDNQAKTTLDKTCKKAKSAAGLVRQSWKGQDDEFTTWSEKWSGMLEGA
ncbi:hypothetical protein BDV96DRAFT_492699 [Lophiotrema nucula]|uniref:Cyclin-D1-binding protein 1-like N-terminal domain-containing protein n=1 Tax=Lophiotrema nucula TaxID=690887 RepID=A0A6A5ZBU5_9PLEO|nr:hypothetical protein BDV96DRAFT_492699 [Lophiotrema nucula]